MKLGDWIKQNGVKELTQKTGANSLYLRQLGWEKTKAKPSLEMAIKIVKATNGEVTLGDLLPDLNKKLAETRLIEVSAQT